MIGRPSRFFARIPQPAEHAPHTDAEKARPLRDAPFGVIGLETAFGVVYTELVERGDVSLRTLLARMTLGPARAFGIERGRLEVGAHTRLTFVEQLRESCVQFSSLSHAADTPIRY